MTHTLKQFEAWATALWRDAFERATIKLTLYYIGSVFFILFISSVATIILFVPPETGEAPGSYAPVSFFALHDLQEHLVSIVVLVDLVVFFFVSIFSYFFARKTLQPIKETQTKQVQFMSDVAHELRTPLAIMRTGAETMLRKERPAHEYESFITDTAEESARLTRLTNQLLQLLRRTEPAASQKQILNVASLVRHEVERFTAYAAEHKVSLKAAVPEEAKLFADQDALVQLLQNLLKNAIDYNRPQGSVTVTLTAKQAEVVLVVADTGVGIPAVEQASIFDRFRTLDKARTSGSMGLGLSIVQTIVAEHNGKIELTSTPNIGTTVTVRLAQTLS